MGSQPFLICICDVSILQELLLIPDSVWSFCGSVNDFAGSVPQMEEDYYRYNDEKADLLSYQLGFHAEYTTKREILEQIAALSQKLKAPVYMHNSETKKEVEECKKRYGKTPMTFRLDWNV